MRWQRGLWRGNGSCPRHCITLIENHLAIAQDLFQSKSNFGKLAVAMSALLPADDDLVWMELSKLEAAYAQVRPLEGPSTEDLLRKADEDLADIIPLLRVSPPRISLVEKYHKAVAAGSETCGQPRPTSS